MRGTQLTVLIAFAAAALLPWQGCGGERPTSGSAIQSAFALTRADGLTWVRLPRRRTAALPGLPVDVTLEKRAIRCRRRGVGARILVQTFQRRGAESAYGVYALFQAKSDLLLDPPLDGDPVAWPDLDHADALARQLGLCGLDTDRARRAVREHAEAWFGEGARVFLVLPREAAVAIEALGTGPLLVVVELDGLGP